jgi:hypothetical protein
MGTTMPSQAPPEQFRMTARPVEARRRASGAAAAPRSTREAVVATGVVVLWIGIAAGLLAWGFSYYHTPLQERAYSALHDRFKPSGTVGLGYGFVGTAMMLVGVLGYSLRRRARGLQRVGRLRTWLNVHIFLATMGPFLILLHTSFKFGGLVSIAFWSMVAVVASGVFGRYVYVRIPKSLSGQFLSLKAVEEQRDRMLQVIAERSGLSAVELDQIHRTARRPSPRGFAGALLRSLWFDLTEKRHARRIQHLLAAKGVPPQARATAARLFIEESALEGQMALLTPFQRLFRYWHLFHMPLAFVMLIVVLVHVAVAIVLGYTWIF